MKRNCAIVQDLFPNYIEGITSCVTNELIEEHIISCKECKMILKNMKEDL